ncbi:MAG: LysR family transcriptional regulator [Myxococcota bacterium]
MDLRRIDLNLLVTLSVLLEQRSVTSAAERLHLSQPAVSGHLRRLREIFDDPLLASQGRRLVPTARARALRLPLAEALGHLARAVDSGTRFEPATSDRVFRIVATDSIHAGLGALLARTLADQAPGLRLAMYLHHDTQGLGTRLVEGQLDAAVLTPSTMPPGLDVQSLYEERFVCVVRRGHPWVGTGLDLDRFCAAQHVMVSLVEGGLSGAVDKALRAMERSRSVRISVPSFLLVPELLVDTDALATVPSRLAYRWRDRLEVLEPPLRLPTFEVLLGMSPHAHGDLGLAWLVERIREISQPVSEPA